MSRGDYFMKEFLISICSGLIGIIITIGYQYFFALPQSFTFIYNGEEMVVTESAYTELVEKNKILSTELLNTQNKLNQLQEQLNNSQDQMNSEHPEQQYDIPLTSLDYFSRNGNVQTNSSFDSKDNYDTVYPYCIISPESEEAFIEYNIDEKYTNLSGSLYVTKRARSINPEYYTWDIATFSIYGDDSLLYTHTGFTTKDEPIPIDVNITGVKFLKIYFKEAFYWDEGLKKSLIGFGNPMIN